MSYLYRMIVTISILLLFVSCVRPPQYRQSLVDAVREQKNAPPQRGSSIAPQNQDLGVSSIRVLLYQGSGFPDVNYSGKFLVYDRDNQLLYSSRPGSLVSLSVGIKDFGHIFTQEPFQFQGKGYRGTSYVVRAGKKWLFILELPLESYLSGVVAKEMSPTWPLEALKAQAIAARSYALYQILQRKQEPFHIRATVAHQVFDGDARLSVQLKKAIEETRGMVLWHQKQLIPAFFHSTSGGITEQGDFVWKQGSYPYTQVKRTEFGKSSPHFQWQYSMDILDLLKLLQERYGFDDVVSFRVVERTPSGRARVVQILGRKRGQLTSVRVLGNEFRMALGSRYLKSLLFQMKSQQQGKRTLVVFQGKGYGHGVGMCQWGAKEMADSGKNAEAILKYYYKDIEIGIVNPENGVIAAL